MRARESRVLETFLILLLATSLGSRCAPKPSEPDGQQQASQFPPEDPARSQEAARRAAALMATRSWPDALAAWDEAWRFSGGSAEMARSYAKALLENHMAVDPPLAIEVLETSFGSPPDDHEALILLARAHYRSDDLVACGEILRLLEDRTDLPTAVAAEAAFLRGSLAEREGDFPRAVVHYREALDHVPEHAAFLCRLGVAEDECGHTEAAVEHFRHAVHLQPDLLEAHFRLVRAYRSLGRENEAELEAKIHRLLNRLTDNQARTEAVFNDRYEALRELERIYPQFLRGRLMLAECQLQMGHPELAERSAEALIKEFPALPGSYPYYITALRRARGDEAARQRLQDLIAEEPRIPAETQSKFLEWILQGFPR